MSISMLVSARRRSAAAAILLATLAASGLSASIAGPMPTVRFGAATYTVAEGDITFDVPVILSEASENYIYALIRIQADTADGDDFHGGQFEVRFVPGEPLTQYLEVSIHEDFEDEGTESFDLIILDGAPEYGLGSPSQAAVTILDDDGGVSVLAHFELPVDVPYDAMGRLAVPVEPGETFSVEVVADDLPPGGGPVYILSNTETQFHVLEFTDSSRETFSIATAAVPDGDESATLELQIVNSDAKRITRASRAAVTSFLFTEGTDACLACVTAYVVQILEHAGCLEVAGCPWSCPPEAPAGTSAPRSGRLPAIDYAADFETLRRYRDEVLQGTDAGDYCIRTYEDLSPAVTAAILSDYTLVYRVEAVWDLWLPAIEAIVDGQGAGFTIDAQMQDALLGVLAELESLGSPALGAKVDVFRTELGLADIAGHSADVLQTRLETNVTGSESLSWGDLKSLYR